MGSLSNLYISQSYQSLIHLATNNTASATLIGLQDGLGNSIGVSVNTGGNLYLSGSLSASLLQGYTLVGDATNRTALVSTSSFGGALPAGTISSSAQITALGFVSSSITASSLITASFSGNTLTFTKGNGTTFGVVIPDVSGSGVPTGTVSSSAQILAYNIFATTGSNTFIGTQTIKSAGGSPLIIDHYDASPTQNTLISIFKSGSAEWSFGNLGTDDSFIFYNPNTFQVPVTIRQDNSVNILGSLTASLQQGYVLVGNASNVSSLVATSSFLDAIPLTSLNTFTASQDTKNSTLASVTSSLNSATASLFTSASLALVTASVSLNTITFTKGDTTTFAITVNTGSGGSAISVQDEGTILGTATSFNFNGAGVTATLSAGTASVTIPGGGGSIDTGSFATTGSNTFTGDQTFIDNAGNFFTISDVSGSMLLVGKSYTSASAHLSASVPSPSGSFVNLIFKANNNTPDTIISGSNNIFTNPNAPTAGFKRYVGGSGNIYPGTAWPLISGSMAFSPAMNRNIGNSIITMRGPVSSSAWTINDNVIPGTINIGNSAANNAEKLVSGLTLSTNTIQGTLNVVANQVNLTSSATINTNIIGGAATLNLNSSSATFSNNIVADNGFTFTNNYYTNSVGQGLPQANRNLIIGSSNTILTNGIGDLAAAGTQPQYNNNIIGGTSNTLFINATSASTSNQIINTIIYGNTLIVTGSSNNSTTNGSGFFGRYNANDGIRNSTAGTIFSVGTGTSAGSRKTGFLIDSGSNTFIEGSLTVSGSTSLTGSITLSGSIITIDRSGNNTNTAIGLNALGMNFAGAQPLAVGNTISVAIGQGAMRFASGSNQNVAIGNNALLITSGSKNFAMGSEALSSNTTGQSNIAIGTSALTKNTIGSLNTAIGDSAGFNTSGSNNTFIGQYAGYNVTGSNNTIMGSYQGTTGIVLNNNIILADGQGNIKAQYSGSAWSFQDGIKLNTGTNKTTDIVSVNSTLTVNNSLVTANSIIFLTTQNSGTSPVYPAVVTSKGTGTFDIAHSYGGALNVAYLIINPG